MGGMSGAPAATTPSRLRQLAEFARASEPRKALSTRSAVFDVFLAAAFLVASLYALRGAYGSGFSDLSPVLTSVPLAARRRYPLTVFLVIVLAALLTNSHATDVTFAAIVFAGYSAAVHSRFRGAALLALMPVGLVIAVVFWSAGPTSRDLLLQLPERDGGTIVLPGSPGLAGINSAAAGGPLRVAGLLVLVSLVSVAVVGAVIYAGDRIRRLQTEHEEATRLAIERERARIASELHDVVTHNVSVMIVQAGAARQVLADSPGRARTALLAVEASGRAAMAELRHLLGLLNPALTSSAGPAGATMAGAASLGTGAVGSARADAASIAADEGLQPQPGLAQLRPLIDRVSAAGLPVQLRITGEQRELPAGLDLAAYRVVQEALTNVLKHAGKSATSVTLEYRDDELLVDVADAGRPDLTAGLSLGVPSGTGRGLLGLRERAALYGGQVDAGPRPGGGWRVRARFPVDPPSGMYRLRLAGLTPTAAEPQ
jgi:signal transduction histidine kinase